MVVNARLIFLFALVFIHIPVSLYLVRRYCGYDAYTVLRFLYIMLFVFCAFTLYFFVVWR